MTSRLSFASNTGMTYPLDGSDGISLINLVDGLTTVPRDLIIDQRVAADGGVLVNARRGPRRILLDVMIPDEDSLNVLATWGPLFAAFEAGGTLIFEGPNGMRELRQMELESPIRRTIGPDGIDDVWTISLLALDPLWYGPVESLTFMFGAPTAWNEAIAWNAIIPWNGGATQQVSVDGHAPVYPVFVAKFGIAGLTMSNGVESWSLNVDLPGTLARTDVVTVDHRVGSRGPHYGSDFVAGHAPGPVSFRLLTENSRVDWSIPVGPSNLFFGADSIGGSSDLTMYWESRWLTP